MLGQTLVNFFIDIHLHKKIPRLHITYIYVYHLGGNAKEANRNTIKKRKKD